MTAAGMWAAPIRLLVAEYCRAVAPSPASRSPALMVSSSRGKERFVLPSVGETAKNH